MCRRFKLLPVSDRITLSQFSQDLSFPIDPASWLDRLWPSARSLALADAAADLQAGRDALVRMRRTPAASSVGGVNRWQLYAEMARLGVATRFMQVGIHQFDEERRDREAAAREAIDAACRKMLAARIRVFRELGLYADLLAETARKALTPALEVQAAAAANVDVELRKLGRGGNQ